MKSINIIALFLMLSATQVNGQQLFSNIAMVNSHRQEMISFTLPKEVNVVYYRIEASNDSNEFDIIGRLASSGNSVLPKAYKYELKGQNYKYYRVGMVGMDGSLHYSKLLNAGQVAPLNRPIFKTGPDTNKALANLQ